MSDPIDSSHNGYTRMNDKSGCIVEKINAEEMDALYTALKSSVEEHVILGLTGEAEAIALAMDALSGSRGENWQFDSGILIVSALYERLNSLQFIASKAPGNIRIAKIHEIAMLKQVLSKIAENGFANELNAKFAKDWG